jgi:hypothetical protein
MILPSRTCSIMMRSLSTGSESDRGTGAHRAAALSTDNHSNCTGVKLQIHKTIYGMCNL